MSAPFIGEIVHYLSHGSKDGTHPQVCRPAMVVEDPHSEKVNYQQEGGEAPPRAVMHVVVFNPTGQFFNDPGYALPAEGLGGTWHWPCQRRTGDDTPGRQQA